MEKEIDTLEKHGKKIKKGYDELVEKTYKQDKSWLERAKNSKIIPFLKGK